MNKMLEIGIIDLVSKKPTNKLFARIMNANFASIMPQVVGVWCEEEGHNVNYICYTGKEDLINDLPINADMVFICAFTESSLTAYALSNLLRSLGAVTVLGGPHARCYPEDAVKYFDYVVGFTDKKIIQEILYDRSPHRPMGLYLNAQNQPLSLPGVRERWKFIEPTLKKAPLIKMVPMLGSLGCPYKCSFCIDSTVAYQPLNFEILKEDLKFLFEINSSSGSGRIFLLKMDFKTSKLALNEGADMKLFSYDEMKKISKKTPEVEKYCNIFN